MGTVFRFSLSMVVAASRARPDATADRAPSSRSVRRSAPHVLLVEVRRPCEPAAVT
jgi:hypothetical protein